MLHHAVNALHYITRANLRCTPLHTCIHHHTAALQGNVVHNSRQFLLNAPKPLHAQASAPTRDRERDRQVAQCRERQMHHASYFSQITGRTQRPVGRPPGRRMTRAARRLCRPRLRPPAGSAARSAPAGHAASPVDIIDPHVKLVHQRTLAPVQYSDTAESEHPKPRVIPCA